MKIKRNETYGAFIKRIRQTAKLTQADFAIAVGVGANSVSKRAIDEFAKTIK
jgi:transcriptional regulator with XRE-family HTH domain